jgi:L-ribulose-5-phosphate 3-epimerase
MMQISFLTANYVARQINYHMDGGWGQGDKATNEHFKPIKTFGDRFEVYLNDIRNMGFEAIDIWTSIINPAWVTDDHIDTANDLLAEYKLPVVSLAGWFGSTADEFEAACNLATELATEILGGSTSLLKKDRPLTIAILQKYGLKLGLENHPQEKNAQDMLDQIRGGGDGTIGACVDTGWFGTQGYDAAKALEELAPHLMHVHLKDVLKVGTHESCRYGEGVVPIRECVETLKRIGYTGAISVEHEPDFEDPTQVCIDDLQMLKEWLNE